MFKAIGKFLLRNFAECGPQEREHRGYWKVPIADRPENCGFCGEGGEIVVEVTVESQRQIDHFHGLGDNFCAAAKACEEVTNVAVVLFDGHGQVFAGEELVLRDEAVIALPVISDEGLALDADFVEEFLTCGVITTTKNPGDGSPSHRVIGSPKPHFFSLFLQNATSRQEWRQRLQP